MDLETFVAETIVQIVEGVADAQKRDRRGGRGVHAREFRAVIR